MIKMGTLENYSTLRIIIELIFVELGEPRHGNKDV